MKQKISILGAGDIGLSISEGLIKSKQYSPSDIMLTRRNTDYLKKQTKEGLNVTNSNKKAVKFSNVLILCVGPQQLKALIKDIDGSLSSKHLIISVVSGISLEDIKKQLSLKVNVVRAMPNTASALCQ